MLVQDHGERVIVEEQVPPQVERPEPAHRRSTRTKKPPDKYRSGEYIMAQRASPTSQGWKEKLEALNQLVILNPMHEEFIQQIRQKMFEVII